MIFFVHMLYDVVGSPRVLRPMVEAVSNKIIATAWLGSVVNGMFLDRVVIGGVPAKILRELNNGE